MNLFLGYSFTLLNYIFYSISRFCDKKYKMLTLDLLAKVSTIVALFFMGSLSGAYSMFVSFVILIVANIKERKQGKWSMVYILFEMILIFIMILRFEGISSILVFATSSISLLSIWWLKPQGMRIAGLITNVTSLLFQISIKNWVGLLEIIVIGSNMISFVKYQREVKQRSILETELE